MHARGGVCTYLYACGNTSAYVLVRNPRCACGRIQGRATRLQHRRKQTGSFPTQSVSFGIPSRIEKITKHSICNRNTTKHATQSKFHFCTPVQMYICGDINTPACWLKDMYSHACGEMDRYCRCLHTHQHLGKTAEGNRIARLPVLPASVLVP